MLREYAETGSVLKLYDSDGVLRRFTITEIKGEGGNCLVYGAKSSGGLKSVIKEFFPLLSQDYSFSRTDDGLFIDKSISVSEDFLIKEHRFVSSVSLMNKLAFSEETAEETLPAELLTNQNGIPYILSEWNPQRVSCYEDVKTSSLNEIATVCLHLAEITLAYHNMGLVHLDIKPSNILWSKKYHYIKLFDLDTITALDNGGQTFRLRGTDGFDAPEVQDHSMVNTKSDVYSIGAIIFERVMGRTVNSAAGDRVSFGYEKQLSEMPLITGETPEAEALIKTILRGSICAAPGKRMNIDRMKELLSQLVKLTQTEEVPAAQSETPAFFKKHRAVIFTVLLCAVLLAACGAGFLAIRNRPSVSEQPLPSKNIGAAGITQPTTPSAKAPEPPEEIPPETPAVTEDTATAPQETQERHEASSTAEPETTSHSTTAETEPTAVQTNPPHTTTSQTTTTQQTTTPPNTTTPQTTTPPQTTTASVSVSEKPLPEPEELTASEGFSYLPYGDGIELSKYNGAGGKVIIPQSIDGKRVIRLGDDLFLSREDITSFVIPEGIKEIGNGTFNFCTSISEIHLPDSLEILQSNALYGLTGLHEVYIPENVYHIDGLTFGGWSGFDCITVSENNRWFCSVDGVLYDKGMTKLLFYPAYKADKEFTIPDTVISIDGFGFDRPRYLEKLHIGANVRDITPYQIFGLIKEFTVDSANNFYTVCDGALFSKDMTSLLGYPSGSERTEWTVPESVKRVECGSITQAFYLRTLTFLKIPEYIDAMAINDFRELSVSFNGTLYSPEEFYSLYLSQQ